MLGGELESHVGCRPPLVQISSTHFKSEYAVSPALSVPVQLLPPRARGAAQAQTPLGRSSERSVRLAQAWHRVAGSALKAVHQQMHRREIALGKCIIDAYGIAQRAGSLVAPRLPMMHFCGPWLQAPPSQALPREINSFVLLKCMAVGKILPVYGSAQLKGFSERQYPPLSRR